MLIINIDLGENTECLQLKSNSSVPVQMQYHCAIYQVKGPSLLVFHEPAVVRESEVVNGRS